MKPTLKLLVFAFALLLTISCNQGKDPEAAKMEAEKMALESKIIENNKIMFKAWNEGNPSLLDDVTVENFTRYQNGELTGSDRASYAELMKTFQSALPDMNFTYDIVAKGNKTYTKWSAKGTAKGMFGDINPTNEISETHGFTILTFNEEGLATTEEAYMDPLTYLKPWGYTMVPPASE